MLLSYKNPQKFWLFFVIGDVILKPDLYCSTWTIFWHIEIHRKIFVSGSWFAFLFTCSLFKITSWKSCVKGSVQVPKPLGLFTVYQLFLFTDVVTCSGCLATDIRDLLWRLYGAEHDKYLYNILFCMCYLGIRLRSQNAELFFVSWSFFCPRYTYL
jgi:hypothetical protein